MNSTCKEIRRLFPFEVDPMEDMPLLSAASVAVMIGDD